MANVFGLERETRTPDAVLEESGAGLVTFTERLVGRPEDVERVFFALRRRSSTSPDFPGLSLESKRLIFGPGEIHFLDLVWAGTETTDGDDPDAELPEPVWILKRSPSEEPIETHPNFADFAGELGSEKNNAVFNEETGLFEGFKAVAGESNEFAGLEKFLDGGAVVQKTSVFRQVPSGISTELVPRRIGASPPEGAPWPLPSGGQRTWMKTDLNVSQIGAAFEVVEEWTLSGQRGWNIKVYP